METKPQSLLELAFTHLEGFSLPRIGTFVRKYQASAIDHKSKKVLPPSRVFSLEPGEAQLSQLQGFFQERFEVSKTKAEVWAEVLSSFVEKKIQEAGSLSIPKFGKISGSEEAGYRFDPVLVEEDDFFGLKPLGYKLPDASKPTEAEKEKAARQSVLANTTKVEEAPPRKRRKAWPIVLLVLVLALAGTGLIFQKQVKGFLQDMGLMASNEDPKDPEPGNKDPEVVPVDSSEFLASANPEIETGTDPKAEIDPEEGAEDEGVSSPEEEVIVETPVEPDPVEEMESDPAPMEGIDDFDPELGQRPQARQYYLVVASAKSATQTKGIARRTKNSTILRPAQAGNFYRISVFNSADKSKVIQQMVKLKETYSKSWIYYLGM